MIPPADPPDSQQPPLEGTQVEDSNLERLFERLGSSFEDLRGGNRELEQRNVELERRNAELEQKNAELVRRISEMERRDSESVVALKKAHERMATLEMPVSFPPAPPVPALKKSIGAAPAAVAPPRPMAREAGKTRPSRARSLLAPVPGALCLLFLAAAVLFAYREVIFGNGYAPGADQYGHLFRIWLAAQGLVEAGRFPLWMPQWYSGFDYMQYYPVLYTLLGVPIQLITRDVELTYRVTIVLITVTPAVGTYLLAREWVGRPAALLAALAFALSSARVKIVFMDGGLHQGLAIALGPWALLVAWKLLHSPSRRLFVALALLVSAIVVAHQMNAVMFLLSLALFLGIAALGERRPLGHILAAGLPVLFGIVISLWYLLPAVTHFDLAEVPSYRPELIVNYSANLDIFDFGLRERYAGSLYFGLPIVVVAVASLLFRRSSAAIALLSSGLFTLVLAFGVNLPLYASLPLASDLLPWRFLYVSSLYLALGAGLFFEGAVKHRGMLTPLTVLLGLAGAGILGFDQARYLDLVRPGHYPSVESALWLLRDNPSEGRLHLAFPYLSEVTYFLPAEARHRLTTGGTMEGSLQQSVFARTGYYATHGRADYSVHYLALWNVSQVLADNLSGPEPEAFQRAGFQVTKQSGDLALMSRAEQPGYVMKQDRDVIALGVDAGHLVALFPWASVGSSWYLDDYTDEYLATFKLVLLYQTRVRDQFKAMAVVNRMLERGQVVIVASDESSLSRMQGAVVERVPVEGERTATIRGSDVLGEERTVQLGPFGETGNPWGAVYYPGLDKTLIEVERGPGEAPLPLFGYNETPRGRIYFLGFTLLHHAVSQQDEAATRLVEQLLDLVQPNKQIFPSGLDTQFTWGVDRFEFDYSLEAPTPAIVSVTYSPHWRATVNGQPLRFVNHENLMLVHLPPGQGRVVFEYTLTPVQYAGAGLSALGLLMLVLFVSVGWTRLLRLRWVPAELMIKPSPIGESR